MKKTNADVHFDELMQKREFRIEFALLQLAEKLATQIKRIREQRGLTQRQMAELLETKQSRVSQMEDPLYAKYSLATLAKVADALQCRLDVALVPSDQRRIVQVGNVFSSSAALSQFGPKPENRSSILEKARDPILPSASYSGAKNELSIGRGVAA